MTKTPRERFEEKFPRFQFSINESPWDGEQRMYSTDTEGFWSFIETLLEEARQEMKPKKFHYEVRALPTVLADCLILQLSTKDIGRVVVNTQDRQYSIDLIDIIPHNSSL